MKKNISKSKGLPRASLRTQVRSMSRGFTLIELLITISIFSTVIILASSSLASGFMTGRLHSTTSQEANRNINLVFDILGQKMANANAHTVFSVDYYGFKDIYPDILLIVSKSTTGGLDQCTYIGKRDNAIKMAQKDCTVDSTPPSGSGWTPPLDNAITSDKVKVTGFELTAHDFQPTSTAAHPIAKLAPFLEVKITVEDTKTHVKETVQTSYSIPYLTYKSW